LLHVLNRRATPRLMWTAHYLMSKLCFMYVSSSSSMPRSVTLQQATAFVLAALPKGAGRKSSISRPAFRPRNSARRLQPLHSRQQAQLRMAQGDNGDSKNGGSGGGEDEDVLARASRLYATLDPGQQLFVQSVYIFVVVSSGVAIAADALRLLNYAGLYPFSRL
jgi:hypothetical protein